MKLTEAIQLTRKVRETWKEGAKGYWTTVYNSAHLVELLNNPEIDEIRPIHVVELQEKLSNLGKSPATINRVTQALRTILTCCVQMEELEKVPYFKQLKEAEGRQVIYTEQEENALYQATKKLEKNSSLMFSALRFAFLTGCRQGELLKLTWKDVDWNLMELTFVSTKSGQHRVLPLQGKLLELMLELYEERIDDQVFSIGKDALIYWFRKVKQIAGMTEKEKVFHTIRHTVCSRLWLKGADQPSIMSVMGHTQASTTQRYSHSTKNSIHSALSLL